MAKKQKESSDADLIEYLSSVVRDKKASSGRRDRAAAHLARYLNNRRKMRARMLEIKYAAENPRKQREPRAARDPKAPKGKKAKKQAAAAVTASGDSWSDLIPKAQVIELSERKKA